MRHKPEVAASAWGRGMSLESRHRCLVTAAFAFLIEIPSCTVEALPCTVEVLPCTAEIPPCTAVDATDAQAADL